MIGFFDSGLGGLTILQEVIKQRPHESYLYLGDNVRAPYGERSAEEIRAFTAEGVAWLIAQGCRLVILACNTASAEALRFLQQDWLPKHAPNVRVLGILVPTVEAITGVGWHEERTVSQDLSVLIFATPSTVASGAYEREILKRSPRANIILQSCPNLVPLIEGGASQETLTSTVQAYVSKGLSRLSAPIDAVLLGCTHYALIKDLFRASVPTNVRLFSQPTMVARALQEYLKRHPEFVITQTPSSLRFATTGDPRVVSTASRQFFPTRIVYERATISHAHL